jgi:glycosyltransferase involved in cell wall biosynthesis
MSKKYKLAALTSHPIQYQAPLFRKLAEHSEIDLMVYFCSDHGVTEKVDPGFGIAFKWDIPLLHGYPYKFLKNFSFNSSPSKTLGLINLGIITELWRNRYDALLIHGYTLAINWIATLGAVATRTPIIFRGETDLLLPRSKWKRILKRFLLPRLFKQINAFLFSYTGNADYYKHYGVSDRKFFFCPCAVDNAFWQEQAQKLKDQKPTLKQQFGIPPESPAILFVGKLIPIKRPFNLLQAFEGVPDKLKVWLVLVGDGPLKSDLAQYVKQRSLQNVCFTGFKNQSEIAPFYAMADMFVLCSDHDSSPKVLNEAMNFALPVITTNRVGTSPDLVKQGENGFIYPVGDVDTLRSHLLRLLENPELREMMGQHSLEIVSKWSFEEDVKGILAALGYVHKDRIKASHDA